jgi:fido (protein-threonine AMPylation protein)
MTGSPRCSPSCRRPGQAHHPATVYDFEQGHQDRVFDELRPSALNGSLLLDELLSDYFVRDLYTPTFGPVWNWAGRWRRLELNIGAPQSSRTERPITRRACMSWPPR